MLVPALLGWPYARLPADARKAFEVSLHAGSGLALAWLLRDDIRSALRAPGATALLAAPAAVAGAAAESAIEKSASSPRVTAMAMLIAGAALTTADGGGTCSLSQVDAKGVKGSRSLTRLGEVGVGLAQALALIPGVSRNGATITAARALGADRETATRLSWRAGLPVIAGAVAFKSLRLARHGLAPALRAPFAAGAVAACVSTLASAPLLKVRDQRFSGLYRVALGAAALRRLHRLEWPA